MDDTRAMDAEVGEPFLDVGNSFLFWSKHVMNLFRCPVFSKTLRIRMRSISFYQLGISGYTCARRLIAFPPDQLD
jgi:hypothetical protein